MNFLYRTLEKRSLRDTVFSNQHRCDFTVCPQFFLNVSHTNDTRPGTDMDRISPCVVSLHCS